MAKVMGGMSRNLLRRRDKVADENTAMVNFYLDNIESRANLFLNILIIHDLLRIPSELAHCHRNDQIGNLLSLVHPRQS